MGSVLVFVKGDRGGREEGGDEDEAAINSLCVLSLPVCTLSVGR